MNSFIQRHRDLVIGQLNGWDRLHFRGSKRLLCTLGGMMSYLWQIRVLNKDFKDYAMAMTEQLRNATVQVAESIGQKVHYLPSSSLDKEQKARAIVRQRGVREGLIAVFSATEPCLSYHLHRNRETKTLDLNLSPSKCLHYYHYYQHPKLGFLHVRLQTWFPFTMHICINGREWLARQMDAAGLGYKRMENCFVDLADPLRAQKHCRIDMGAHESDHFRDCQGDGFADACQLRDGEKQDCNGNLVPDDCDIASGESTDCYSMWTEGPGSDGIPDECQGLEWLRYDLNRDCRVDAEDFALWQLCYTTGEPIPEGCENLDVKRRRLC